MILKKSTTGRMFVRLVDATTGNGVAGVLPADISDGAATAKATAVKADGTVVTITLVASTNWFEVHATKAPGLYQVEISSSIASVVGPLSLALFPTAALFKGSVYLADVTQVEDAAVETLGDGASASDVTLGVVKDAAEATLGKWKIFTTGPDTNRLVLYRPDGTTVLKKFDLKKIDGTAGYDDPFARIPV